MSFHGSYPPADVTFLLKPIALAPTPVAEKERLVQSGAVHYSEVLAPEAPPTDDYLRYYRAAMARNGARVGREVASLARALAQRGWPEVVLVSLARAGTPIGVLLRRALARLGHPAVHYSVSIIRGRGVDANALDTIVARHGAEHVVFVDGWTGKGAIARQLHEAIADYARTRPRAPRPELVALADLAGVADLAASCDDYVLPSSILNAVVSGLISRTVLNGQIGPGDYHGCVYYADWAAHDLSLAFVDAIDGEVARALPGCAAATWPEPARAARRERCARFVAGLIETSGVDSWHRVKPGAGEATRAVLRRVPHRVLVRDRDDPEVAHLVWLAERRGVTPEVHPDMPYRAVTLVQTLGAAS